ncbi:potassium transporter Kup [Lactobacillus paraplantarum] [Lactiplantibacillus mudanjiangensis]|nr:potassium transporter Kup [Lactobacillus paraplantarum] [Lactiplantibacillus mudanjiangensis]
MTTSIRQNRSRPAIAGMLITIGIVYGDIGTSPLYVMQALLGDAGRLGQLTPTYIYGSISLIFWTLMLMTTIKYILIAMRADNHHEGGILALYALIRKRAKWALIPALIGGAALLADGTLTPAVTVTSAVEGLKGLRIGSWQFSDDQLIVLLAVTVILLLLFMSQRFGTALIGHAFGPLMLIWFSFIAITGLINLNGHWDLLRALSPTYAWQLLVSPTNKMGIFILGSIFLATTGAEALYSDMGHVGRINIYWTWPFIYLALMLNYLGQGAWLLTHYRNPAYQNATNLNPFFAMLPTAWQLPATILATIAAVIASQALITGSFTLVNEAIGLKVLPRLRINHPSRIKSQLYIPTVNWLLCAGTLAIVWLFQTSHHMEAAYGLAITLTMLMTTALLFEYIKWRANHWLALLVVVIFGSIEMVFLIASLTKFMHGGYFTVILTILILLLMLTWYWGNRYRERLSLGSEHLNLRDYRKQLMALSADETQPLTATNLVYITKVSPDYQVKRTILYSILDKRPKRAQVYWFISITETDEPDEASYTVDMMGTRNIVNVQLRLGFKQAQPISQYLRQIVTDLLAAKAINPQYPHYTKLKKRQVGDFKFVLTNQKATTLSLAPHVRWWQRGLIAGRIFLQRLTASQATWYGLEFSDVLEETVPLFLTPPTAPHLAQTALKHVAKPTE